MSDAALSTIIKRLEAATVKLEDMASRGLSTSGPTSSISSTSPSTLPAAVSAFDELVNNRAKIYVDLSLKIGGIVKEQADAVVIALQEERRLIEIASCSKKPIDQTTLQSLMKPLLDAGAKVMKFRENNRASPVYTLLCEVAEGISGLVWVGMEPAPAPFVAEYRDSAQFWANRVIAEFREKDKMYVEWANSFVSVLGELQIYVKKVHTTGLTWNPKGGDAKSASGSSVQSAAATSTEPLPAVALDSAALFGELNKQGGVTAGLRKVDKSEMTHKNPELRASSIVPATAAAPKATSNTNTTSSPAKLPKFVLEGSKWAVENQSNNSNLVIENADIKQSVYIYNCQNSTIQIKGKIKTVVLDNCKKVGVVVDTVLATVDTVNCKSVQIQITGTCPTINIDKTDGVQVYLSKSALGAEIMTAKSSEMNVLFEGADGDFIEKPVVEQFKTIVKNGALVTVPVEHLG